MLRTIRPENPRAGQTGNLIPTPLLALVVCLCLTTGAGLQTDTSPDDGSTTEAPGSKDRSNDRESSGADASDPSPLAEHRQTINRLLHKRNFGPAMNRAFAMRRKLDGTKWSEASAEFYFSVQDRIEAAYEDVKSRTSELTDQNQPYRAYRYLKNKIPEFARCAPYERRLKRKRRALKVKVIEAYNNGELDTKPDFIPDRNPTDSSSGDSSRDDPNGNARKNTPRKGNPRIYAQDPTMSNAPDSPKSFDGKVVKATGDTVQFEVDFHGKNSREKMGFFLFELRGLQGWKKIRIDFVNMGRWDHSKAIVPLYSKGVAELSDLTMLRSKGPKNGRIRYTRTDSGQIVPKTRGLQKWHYFKNVEVSDDEQTLVVRKRIPKNMDHTFVTHRVPYPYAFHQAYIDKLEERARYSVEGMTVHEVGKSGDDRPLHVVELASTTDPEAKNKPVVVVQAGEHGDEMDPYLAARGALEFLLSDHPRAKVLRKKATFLFLLAQDVDALAECRYENIIYTFKSKGGFVPGKPSKTSKEIGRWFRDWANQGKRLDVLIDLHCVEAGETDKHMFSYLVEHVSVRHDISRNLWNHVRKYLSNVGYRVDPSPRGNGFITNRLGGFLRKYMASMWIFPELNSQPRPPGRKLILEQINRMGRFLIEAVVTYLHSKKAKPLLKTINDTRSDRRKLVERYQWFLEKEGTYFSFHLNDPFDREGKMWFLPTLEREVREWLRKYRGEVDWQPMAWRWAKKIYKKDGISPDNIPNVDW
jgi:hypothetical protein